MREAEEQLVLDYLRAYPDTFISAAEIARKAGGRHRFFENPRWVWPVLASLLGKGLVETNEAGHYRAVARG